MARAIIITGGNLDNVKARLRQAQQMINDRLGIILRCSHMYESEAWGFTAADNFLNQAIELDTELSPEELLAGVQAIEKELGRDREAEAAIKAANGEPYSSRKIDIDILFYNDLVLESPELTIPHPLMQDRDFVLAPLCEIAASKIHPVLDKTMKELREDLKARMNKD